MAEPIGMREAVLLAMSFLVGAIPFGPIAAGRKGVDLRSTGSGNIGATNVLRSVGKGAAIFTLLGDMLKGAAAVALGKMLGGGDLLLGALGLAAVLGHDFSPFMRFRGGKGVATSLGVILIYAPNVGILTLVLWLVTFAVTRISSVSALLSFALMPAAMAWFYGGGAMTAAACAISLLLFLRHSGNIKRLVMGTEGRIGERP